MRVPPVVSSFLLLLVPMASPLSFNFSRFPTDNVNTSGIIYQGQAWVSSVGVIDLTKNEANGNLNMNRGWAVYEQPVRLWDNATRNLSDFTTTFSFVVETVVGRTPADGLAFFLAPNGSTMPNGTDGGTLALFTDGENNSTVPPPARIVAVEFDTYKNFWDPDGVHVGIDVGSIVSVVNASWANSSGWSNWSVEATVAYAAGAMELTARLSGQDGTQRTLNHNVDLREKLPEWVTVGFSASTGSAVELHKIRSWSFSSSLEVTGTSPPLPSNSDGNKSKVGLLAGLISGLGFLAMAAVSGILWLVLRHRRVTRRRRGEGQGVEMATVDDSEIDEGRGPKRFTYPQLSSATRKFAPKGKLGRGGFGEVYKGFLSELGLEVAVKRVARDSKQGKKEYLSEINIISKLRHRNLVRLVGWCHDRGELLLVYEYLPHGSLDAHLFEDGGKAPVLTWPTRYKIAQGLASALLYLHEGWEQCVVHRDVKSSNVMLDAEFNTKLGDFGLARLVDHGVGMQTTVPAGTWGYLAPECAIGGRASKESDVYSFGVVALEIACGRRAIDHKAAEQEKEVLVRWVWGLYGRRALLDAADERLQGCDLVEVEVERLMVVGLWCAHPDPSSRPSMRQVVAALGFETSPPRLPDQMPAISYGAPSGSWRDGQSASSAASTVPFSSNTVGSYSAVSSVTSGTSTAGSEADCRPLVPSEKS